MNRILYPALGVLIAAATVAQVNATRPPKQSTTAKQSLNEPQKIAAEGRVVTYPGGEVLVGSDVAGTLDQLRVQEKDIVRKGDVLAVIRADDTRAAVGVARARVSEADADIRLFETEAVRAKNLWLEEVGSRQEWERAERDLDSARARRASAAAELRQLEAVVKKTVLTAPISGVIVTRHTDQGETIAIGAPIVTIADLARTRVEAEIDEFDASRVQAGATVFVTAEGHDTKWKGTVEEIPDTVVNRRLKPQDPSKPIDTRVLLVKVALREPTPLKLGQRVEVGIAVE